MPHSNYKYGDTREDGYVWVGKRYNRKGDRPDWRSPAAFERKVAYSKKNKKKTYDLISRLTGEEKMKKEIEKCIVLCANCHRIEEKRIRNEN